MNKYLIISYRNNCTRDIKFKINYRYGFRLIETQSTNIPIKVYYAKEIYCIVTKNTNTGVATSVTTTRPPVVVTLIIRIAAALLAGSGFGAIKEKLD